MKIKTVVLISIVTYSLSLFSQVKGTYYEIIEVGSEATCYLILYNTEEYKIELSYNATDDIVKSLIISFGTYKIINNYYQLEDKFNGSITELIINDKYLVVQKGLKGLHKKKFIIKGQIEDNGVTNFSNKIIPLKHKTLITSLEEITYGSFINDFEVILNINKNNSYSLYYKNFMISKGNLLVEEKKICLYDSSFKHSFNLFREDSCVIINILPFINKFQNLKSPLK